MAGKIAKPINSTQLEFNMLCDKGGGSKSGPLPHKVKALLARSGKALNEIARSQAAEHMMEYADRNPWHVCYALAMNWGHLAQRDLAFTGAAVGLLVDWNDTDRKLASKFRTNRGQAAVENSLLGAYEVFNNVTLPKTLPDTLPAMQDAQERWLKYIVAKRPKYIGSWNAVALFMVALFLRKPLADAMDKPSVLLPPGGPIAKGIATLVNAHVLTSGPSATDDDDGLNLSAIFVDNAIFYQLKLGIADWNVLDVHSGLYMLGTGLPESDTWFKLPPGL